MHRRSLLDLLSAYAEAWPDDRSRAASFAAFVRAHEDCFERTCMPGHVTGSAWIVSADRRRCLLTHHRKLDKWLQLGGHADGDADVVSVALREAREESGLEHFTVLPVRGAPVPLDIDVHRIPANQGEPAHEHYDVRFLFEAAPGQDLVCSEESNDLAWVDVDDVTELSDEESVLRLGHRARMLLESREGC